jgi:hypothetical protein
MTVFSVFFYEVVLCTFVLRDENAIGSECVCVCVCVSNLQGKKVQNTKGQ